MEHIEQEAIQTTPLKIWNKNFTSVFIANACMYMSMQMMNSLVAKYADHLGASATIVGLVTSLFALSALVLKIVSGPAIDAFNRRWILTGAMLVLTCAFVGYSFSHSVPMLMGSRLLQGCGQAFTATCCLALAADTLPPDKFGVGIGVFSMAQAASQAVGPTVALFLQGVFGYNTTFAIGAVIMLFAAVFATQVKTPAREMKPFKISLSNIVAKEAVLPAVIMFFLGTAFCVINSFLIIYAGLQNVSSIGYFFTVYAGTLLITRPLIGRFTDKFGIVNVIIPAMGCFALSFVMISFSTALWMFLLSAFVAAFGFGACQPAIQTLSMKSVPVERRGAASSTNYIGMDLGNLVGPVVAGIIIEAFGYNLMWRVMTVFIGVALLLVLVKQKTIRQIETDFKNKPA